MLVYCYARLLFPLSVSDMHCRSVFSLLCDTKAAGAGAQESYQEVEKPVILNMLMVSGSGALHALQDIELLLTGILVCFGS